MAENGEDVVKTNDNLVLICGKAATGKSLSLMELNNPEGVVYLNCENGKKLPFKSKFQEATITDPYEIYDYLDEVEDMPEVHTVVIDTFTYLMNMYQTKHVANAADGRAAWGKYAQFAMKLFSHYVAKSSKNIIILAHTADVVDDLTGITLDTLVKVKGSLMDIGIESFFSSVISVKKVTLKDLRSYENPMLNISEDDTLVGFKHVFQTRLTKDTSIERVRSSYKMWEQQETFIDNNAQHVLDRLHDYYKD